MLYGLYLLRECMQNVVLQYLWYLLRKLGQNFMPWCLLRALGWNAVPWYRCAHVPAKRSLRNFWRNVVLNMLNNQIFATFYCSEWTCIEVLQLSLAKFLLKHALWPLGLLIVLIMLMGGQGLALLCLSYFCTETSNPIVMRHALARSGRCPHTTLQWWG